MDFCNRRILDKNAPEASEMLLAAARKATPAPEREEEQRRSFAYGDPAFENK
jgi:hypothetical protein